MKKIPLPKNYFPEMTALGTTLVSVNVKRVGWVPVSGDSYYCLRWVARKFGVKDGGEVTQAKWQEMDAMCKHIFELRNKAQA